MNETITAVAIGALLAALGALVLNAFLVLVNSITESQKPRLELLRSALEAFNEATYVLGIVAREAGNRYATALGISSEKDLDRIRKFMDMQDEGMHQLSNAIGQALAIGHSGLAAELRAFQSMIFDEMKAYDTNAGSEEEEILKERFAVCFRTRREQVLKLFEIQLREEALIWVAIRRYFIG